MRIYEIWLITLNWIIITKLQSLLMAKEKKNKDKKDKKKNKDRDR